jgi:hypothetical protein
MKEVVMKVTLMLIGGLAASAALAQAGDEERPAPATTGIDVDSLEPRVDTSAPAEPRERPDSPAPAAPPAPRSVDTLDLGTTSITGNQELPKVLYIVPWKSSDLGDLVGRPVNTLLDEVLAPIDPAVFERHLNYYDTLYGEGQQE